MPDWHRSRDSTKMKSCFNLSGFMLLNMSGRWALTPEKEEGMDILLFRLFMN